MARKRITTTSLVPEDNSINELFSLEETREKKRQIGYIPSFFTTASLPFKNIHKTVFTRKGSNGVTLKLTSPNNVPFGKYGRLLLSILTTHAVISQNNNDSLMIEYASMADLLKELQLPKQRGKDIKEQLECFSNAAFIFTQEKKELQAGYLFKDMYEEGDYPKQDVTVTTKSTGNIRFTEGVQYQEIDDGVGKRTGHFKIALSPEFASFCQAHAVPIDYEVYKDISSPIGKDIYAWLVYRNNGLQGQVFIPRDKFVEQFAPVSEDNTDNNSVNVRYFRLIETLKTIKEKYYKECRVEINEDGSGITLYKSPTPVIKDDVRYALITTDL